MSNCVGVKTNLDDTPHQPSHVNDPPAVKPPCSSQSQSKRRREDNSQDGFIPKKGKRIDPPKVGTVLVIMLCVVVVC